MPLVGRKSDPLHRVLVVLRHPLAEVVHISKAGLHDRGVPTGGSCER